MKSSKGTVQTELCWRKESKRKKGWTKWSVSTNKISIPFYSVNVRRMHTKNMEQENKIEKNEVKILKTKLMNERKSENDWLKSGYFLRLWLFFTSHRIGHFFMFFFVLFTSYCPNWSTLNRLLYYVLTIHHIHSFFHSFTLVLSLWARIHSKFWIGLNYCCILLDENFLQVFFFFFGFC